MRLEEYKELPDYPGHDRVWELTELALDESAGEDVSTTLRKLHELSDRQWHTYQFPPMNLRAKLEEWLLQHWQESEEFLRAVMGLAYCYALDKKLFIRALRNYQCDNRTQYERHLAQSTGDAINPWWSMGPRAEGH